MPGQDVSNGVFQQSVVEHLVNFPKEFNGNHRLLQHSFERLTNVEIFH